MRTAWAAVRRGQIPLSAATPLRLHNQLREAAQALDTADDDVHFYQRVADLADQLSAATAGHPIARDAAVLGEIARRRAHLLADQAQSTSADRPDPAVAPSDPITPVPVTPARMATTPGTARTVWIEVHGDSVLVRGTDKTDTAMRQALTAAGFKWYRSLQCWGLPRNWLHDTRMQRLTQLLQTMRTQGRILPVDDPTQRPADPPPDSAEWTVQPVTREELRHGDQVQLWTTVADIHPWSSLGLPATTPVLVEGVYLGTSGLPGRGELVDLILTAADGTRREIGHRVIRLPDTVPVLRPETATTIDTAGARTDDPATALRAHLGHCAEQAEQLAHPLVAPETLRALAATAQIRLSADGRFFAVAHRDPLDPDGPDGWEAHDAGTGFGLTATGWRVYGSDAADRLLQALSATDLDIAALAAAGFPADRRADINRVLRDAHASASAPPSALPDADRPGSPAVTAQGPPHGRSPVDHNQTSSSFIHNGSPASRAASTEDPEEVPADRQPATHDPVTAAVPTVDPFGPFTPAEQATIRHAVEDWAGNYYGQLGSVHFGRSDAERYVAEGHLKHLYPAHTLAEVWRAVAAHLHTHPEILTAGRLSDHQRAAIHQQRVDQAMQLDREALDAYTAGDFTRARTLIDQAELAAPLHNPYHTTWTAIRQYIDTAQDEATTTKDTNPSGLDRPTPHAPATAGTANQDQEPDDTVGHSDPLPDDAAVSAAQRAFVGPSLAGMNPANRETARHDATGRTVAGDLPAGSAARSAFPAPDAESNPSAPPPAPSPLPPPPPAGRPRR